jgi:NAD(P)-dependent dehydrogenase (short-subunit alcohol dehydrogenase family)
MDVNLKSMAMTIRHVLPVMRQQKSGAICNISSLAAIAGHHMVTYEVSKMAVNRLTTVVAAGNAKHNVRCNVIMPGLMDTPMAITGIAGASGKSVETLRAERSSRVPMGRMGSGWDTAHAALFLCSDEARFVTGAILPVDGGTSVTVG